jgi:hypothetical protein
MDAFHIPLSVFVFCAIQRIQPSQQRLVKLNCCKILQQSWRVLLEHSVQTVRKASRLNVVCWHCVVRSVSSRKWTRHSETFYQWTVNITVITVLMWFGMGWEYFANGWNKCVLCFGCVTHASRIPKCMCVNVLKIWSMLHAGDVSGWELGGSSDSSLLLVTILLVQWQGERLE